MDSLREKVARVLIERVIRKNRQHDTAPERLEEILPRAIDYAWPEELGNADAAIAAVLDALREPSEAMIEAGYTANPYLEGDAPPYICWQAMLSTFLQEQSAPTDGE